MARVYGVAGEWARVRGTVFGLWPLFAGLFLMGLSVGLIVSAVSNIILIGAVAFAISSIWCVATLIKGLRHVERYFKGARGEEHVAGILKELPDDYHVFNDFVARKKHVDHVIAGPAGVFAIETKFWHGRVTLEEGHILVDGHLPSRQPIPQVLKEAEAVKRHLSDLGWSGLVTPVLVFASDTFEAKVAEAKGVVIINSDYIKTAFSSGRTVLQPVELDRLVRLMENV